MIAGAFVLPPQEAAAQVAGAVPAQRFQPTQAATGGYNQLWGTSTLGHLQTGFGLYLDYAYRPLEVYNYTTGEQVDLVSQHLQVDLLASIGIGERFQLDVAVPFSPYITQGADGFFTPPDIAGSGLGDIRLAASYHALGDGSGFDLTALTLVSVPTGNADRYLGEAGPTFEPRLAAELQLGDRLTMAANSGFLVRVKANELTYEGEPLIRAGHELTYGLGGRYALAEKLSLIGELHGGLAFGEQADGSNRPLELDLSARKWFGPHAITLGGGAGLVGGYGTPAFRAFLGYSFVPAPRSDLDGDGIYDEDDLCPHQAEDQDGFEDDNGCPDFDNDNDGLPDTTDACPEKAEDHDNFEDGDGCPELDNDGDGVVDTDDRCPMKPEDVDTFQDADGCPDPDNDEDGFLDAQDKCPLEPETINGVEDDDGCPDEGESAVEVTGTHIRILQKVYFQTNSAIIQERSYNLLNQVAATMRANPKFTTVVVEGHTDDRGDNTYNLNLSRRRAKSVERYLVGRGISSSRLEAIGYGETRPMDTRRTRKARANNRRVEFRIQEVNGMPVSDPSKTGDDADGTGSSSPHGRHGEGSTAERTPSAPAARGHGNQRERTGEGRGTDTTAEGGKRFSGSTETFKVLVFFEHGSANLSPRGSAICKDFAAWMVANPNMRVRLLGFNDESGEAKDDRLYAQGRNKSVRNCLISNGVNRKKIEAKALGSKWPRQPNDSTAHREENRRVRMLPLNSRGKPIEKLPLELKVDLPRFGQ